MKHEPLYAIVNHWGTVKLANGNEYDFKAACEVELYNGRRTMEVVDVIAWNPWDEAPNIQGDLTIDEMVEVEREAKKQCAKEREEIIEKSML